MKKETLLLWLNIGVLFVGQSVLSYLLVFTANLGVVGISVSY